MFYVAYIPPPLLSSSSHLLSHNHHIHVRFLPFLLGFFILSLLVWILYMLRSKGVLKHVE